MLLTTRRKTPLLNCVCVTGMAVEWGLAEEIFSVKIFFFALTPVFRLFLQYSLIMTLKYGILSQSTAVFPQSVENVVNTRWSCMKKKIPSYTVKPV